MAKFKKFSVVVTALFISYTAFSQETKTFNTVTEALNWTGDKATVKKLIITGQISGNDYSDESEWSKFRKEMSQFFNAEYLEITTNQDIPNGSDYKNWGCCYVGLLGVSIGYADERMEHKYWLKNFSAPNTKYIGSYAFAGSPKLTSVDIPLAINIGNFAFEGCKNLTAANFPLVTNIGDSVFWGCENLTSANIPLITTIKNNTFSNCSKLTKVNIPLVTNIGDRAFSHCKKLTSINIPLVTNLGNRAFDSCISLTSIDLPLITNIENRTFAYCEKLTTVNIPLVTSIGDSAFFECENLTAANFPLVTNIGKNAFFWCENLTAANFPLVTNIGDYAFWSCENLTSVIFGMDFETETEINFGMYAFGYDLNVLTPNINLILGENVLPKPDIDKNTWQSDGKGKPYIWKSIKVLDSIVSVKEIRNNSINIFQGPTDFTLNFDVITSSNMKIVLSNTLGQELMNIYNDFVDIGTFNKTIDTENLSKGVYFIKIQIGKDYITEKIIIE